MVALAVEGIGKKVGLVSFKGFHAISMLFPFKQKHRMGEHRTLKFLK